MLGRTDDDDDDEDDNDDNYDDDHDDDGGDDHDDYDDGHSVQCRCRSSSCKLACLLRVVGAISHVSLLELELGQTPIPFWDFIWRWEAQGRCIAQVGVCTSSALMVFVVDGLCRIHSGANPFKSGR